jgi:hypothetical protein
MQSAVKSVLMVAILMTNFIDAVTLRRTYNNHLLLSNVIKRPSEHDVIAYGVSRLLREKLANLRTRAAIQVMNNDDGMCSD